MIITAVTWFIAILTYTFVKESDMVEKEEPEENEDGSSFVEIDDFF